MRIRSDGKETRERILAAACHSFSQNGFRKATHEMICHEADANKAAINHHFGDKQSLYRVVWQHLLDAADSEYPVSGNLPEDSPAAERLEAHIRALMYRHFGQGASWQLERLRLLEHVSPTGMVDEILSEHHDRNRKQMLSVLGELLGGEAPHLRSGFTKRVCWGFVETIGQDRNQPKRKVRRKLESDEKGSKC